MVTVKAAGQIAPVTKRLPEPAQRWWLSFGGELESLYRNEEGAILGKSVAANALIAVGLYDLFLISDFHFTGASFKFYALARLGVCTPPCLLLVFMIRTSGKHFDAFASAVTVVTAATSSAIVVFIQGSFQSSDLFGNVLLMVCGATVSHARLPRGCSKCGGAVRLFRGGVADAVGTARQEAIIQLGIDNVPSPIKRCLE